jgi:5-methylcytosine-specific restriction endonuclease McrA
MGNNYFYDWKSIQQYYDEGKSYSDLIKKYGMSNATLRDANKRGELKTRESATGSKNSVKYREVKKWRKLNKFRLFQAFGGKCGCCGLVDDPIAYDFHHLVPAQKDIVIGSKITGWEKTSKEAKKCAMLCAICHRKVHSGMISIPEDCPMFDNQLIDWPEDVEKTKCVICGNPTKERKMRTCSIDCNTKNRRKIDWDSIDLQKLIADEGSYEAAGRKLGITGNAIRKHIKVVFPTGIEPI